MQPWELINAIKGFFHAKNETFKSSWIQSRFIGYCTLKPHYGNKVNHDSFIYGGTDLLEEEPKVSKEKMDELRAKIKARGWEKLNKT